MVCVISGGQHIVNEFNDEYAKPICDECRFGICKEAVDKAMVK